MNQKKLNSILENKIFNGVWRAVLWLFYFIRYSVRQFYTHRGLQIAASLAYATLLSLVPLITVIFGVFKGMAAFESLGETIQAFVIRNFVPAFSETVQEYLSGFSEKAAGLTATGLVVLIFIVLMLLATIDNSFNVIWHVSKRRSPASRFLVYWTILTLGPVLVGAGLFITSYLFSFSFMIDMDASIGFREQLLPWLPFFTTAIAFTLLYVLIPNCYVSRTHALIGGISSAALFEVAKYGFGYYVKAVPTYQLIYGAIAVIPIFLIWIYISWVIVILGAHITFCLSSFRLLSERVGRREPEWNFIDVCRVVSTLWRAQKDGRSLSVPSLRKRGARIPIYQINEIMEVLESNNWVHRDAGNKWLLSRDLSDHRLIDIYHIVPNRMPFKELTFGDSEQARKLKALLEQYYGSLEEVLSVDAASVLK